MNHRAMRSAYETWLRGMTFGTVGAAIPQVFAALHGLEWHVWPFVAIWGLITSMCGIFALIAWRMK